MLIPVQYVPLLWDMANIVFPNVLVENVQPYLNKLIGFYQILTYTIRRPN